jgi:hypothetical protein
LCCFLSLSSCAIPRALRYGSLHVLDKFVNGIPENAIPASALSHTQAIILRATDNFNLTIKHFVHIVPSEWFFVSLVLFASGEKNFCAGVRPGVLMRFAKPRLAASGKPRLTRVHIMSPYRN